MATAMASPGSNSVGEKGQVSRASHLNTGRAGPSASTKAAQRLDEYWSSGLTLAVLVTPTMEVSEPRDLLDVGVRRQRRHLRVCQGHAGAWQVRGSLERGRLVDLSAVTDKKKLHKAVTYL